VIDTNVCATTVLSSLQTPCCLRIVQMLLLVKSLSSFYEGSDPDQCKNDQPTLQYNTIQHAQFIVVVVVVTYPIPNEAKTDTDPNV